MPGVSPRPLSTQSSSSVTQASERATERGGSLEAAPITDRSGAVLGEAQVAMGASSMAENPAFEQDAIAFERALGQAAFRDGLPAAEAMSAKAKAYIQAKAGPWEASNARLQAELAKTSSNEAGWSGAVGTAIEDVMAVFDSGNVATRMNHLGEFYTHILGEDLASGAPEVDRWIQQAHLEEAEIEERKRQMNGTKWSFNTIDPNSEVAGQGQTRVRSGEDARTELTVAESGVTLDPAEAQLQEQAAVSRGETWDPTTGALSWQEGARVWMLNEANAWVERMRSLSLPLAAGPSGTTNMLMNTAQVLGGVSPVDARLACMGYLLPANHHSLVEVMVAAASFGAPYVEGQQMYRHIAPYNDTQLRTFGGGRFPDEPALA